MKHLLFLTCLFISSSVFAQTAKYHKVKVTFSNTTTIQDIASLGIEADHGHLVPNKFWEGDVSDYEISILKNARIPYEIVIEDMVKYYQDRNKKALLETEANYRTHGQGCFLEPIPEYPISHFAYGSMMGYYRYSEYLEQLDLMQATYPNLISSKYPISSIVTHEGRTIYGIKISDNPNTNEAAESQILYTGVHHAREVMSLFQNVYYMWYLLENYATDPSVKYLVDNMEMYFVPCLNPDGYIYNETTDPQGGGMWRKNRRDNQDSTFGVDLNRNYGHEWGLNDVGSSPSTNNNTYRGPSPFSEPETQAMREFCNNHTFKLALNAHSYSNVLIYPWGYNDSFTPDSSTFIAIAKELTREDHYAFGTGTEVIGYNVNGDSDDWMYGEQTSKPKILAMTPETGSWEQGFWPVQADILPLCQSRIHHNLMAATTLLNYPSVTLPTRPLFVSNLTFNQPFELTKIGFLAGDVSISFVPISANIQTNPSVYNYTFTHLQTTKDSISIQLNPATQPNENVVYALIYSNGSQTWKDTISTIYKPLPIVFEENGSTLVNWENNGWNTAANTSTSAPFSITESPNGKYNNNSVATLISPTINLQTATEAFLVFNVKYQTEKIQYPEYYSSYDNLSVIIKDIQNNTEQSVCVENNTHYVYQGEKDWSTEYISLQEWVGKPIQVYFQFVSNDAITGDGYYLDDIKIYANGNTNASIQDINKLAKPYPNPSNTTIRIPYSITQKQTLEITDIQGKLVSSYAIHPDSNTLEIDVHTLANGLYLAKITNTNQVIKFSVLK